MRVEGIGEIRNVVGCGAARARHPAGAAAAAGPRARLTSRHPHLRHTSANGCRGAQPAATFSSLAASTASVRSHSCSGSRRCTGCHHIALWMGVASNGGSYTRTPPVLRA